jgi:glycosyltransferase involved in cell wall biosynthesis
MPPGARIAVISPFLDKKHGTERCITEELERLSGNYEFHLYSMRVEDMALSSIRWHRIPRLPGPLFFRYVWWFIANHCARWWGARFGDTRCDLLFSPGVNCLDADIIAVHVVFAEFYSLMKPELNPWRNPVRSWPRLLHRWCYYHLLMALERIAYTNPKTLLVPVSKRVAGAVQHWYGRSDVLPAVYNGADLDRFSPEERARLRAPARLALRLDDAVFAILLIGNGWKNKGLPCLLSAVERLADPCLHLLVVGQDDVSPYESLLRRTGLSRAVSFLPIRPDVELYYAAADAYAGPSLEDAFPLPQLEAMACGLPVIVSRRSGVSEIITPGVDGVVLEDSGDAATLASLLRSLRDDAGLRRRVGALAARTARRFSWERNATEMKARFEIALERKRTAAKAHVGT